MMSRDSGLYAPIDWANPVSNHSLNELVSLWLLNTPNNQGGTVWRDMLNRHHPDFSAGMGGNNWVRGNRSNSYGALTFDGGDGSEHISFPFTPDLDVTRNETFSISLWIKPSIFAAMEYPSMLMWGLWRFTLGLAERSGAGDGKLECWFNNSDVINSNTALTLNEQAFVGISTNGTTVTFYLNGIADGTGSHSAITDANDVLGIGGKVGGSSDSAYAGELDDIRIYLGHELSANEWKQLYDESSTGYHGLLNRLSNQSVIAKAAAAAAARRIILIS